MNGNLKAVLLLIWLASGITLFTTGCVDIDWMVNQYRGSEWHRTSPDWWFTPTFKMPWWDAYFFTLLRIIVGASSISTFLFYVIYELTRK